MKLNQRDKLILVGVLVFVILLAGVLLFIKPAVESVKAKTNERDSKEMTLQEKQKQIKDDENLKQDVQDAYNEATEVASIFMPRKTQHEAATDVQKMFNVDNKGEQEIENQNLALTLMTTYSLERYVFTPYDSPTPLTNITEGEQEKQENVKDPRILNNYVFQFTFKAKKKDLITFMENLQKKTQKSVVISAVTIKNMGDNKDDTEIEGSMSLDYIMASGLITPEEAQAKQDAAPAATATDESAAS